MQKQNGFTLVELVVVIIILGILAVTAAPKFINMQGDARVSTLQGVKGAINGANVMVYAKASLEGKNSLSNQDVTLVPKEGDTAAKTIKANFGYVTADSAEMIKAADLSANDWILTDAGKTPANSSTPVPANTVRIQQVNAPSTCYIEYKQASKKGDLPSFTHISTAKEC